MKRKLHEITALLRTIDFKAKPAIAAPLPPIRYNPKEYDEADRNHVIGKQDELAVGGAITRLNANMDAILMLKRLELEGRNPSKAEKQVLAKFVGWGGVSEVFKPDIAQHKEFAKALLQGEPAYKGYALPAYSFMGKNFEQITKEVLAIFTEHRGLFHYGSKIDLDHIRHTLVHYFLSTFGDSAYQDAINSTINAHYTSRTVIEKMWELLDKVGFQGGTVLETSAGIGHFFGLMPAHLAERSALYGIEKDAVSGRLLARLYPQANIQVTGFEKANLPLGSFDLVVGNVPFGKTDLVQDTTYPKLSAFNLHNYFIAKSLVALRPGGFCFVITSSSTMDNGEVRENDNKKSYVNSYDFRRWADAAQEGNADLLGAIRLPNNAFLDNANTEVVTDIILLRKRDSDTPHPLAQTWIGLRQVGEGAYHKTNRDLDNIAKNKIKEASLPTTVPLKVNEYYAENPAMMIGQVKLQHESKAGRMYGDPNRPTVELDNPAQFPKLLNAAFATLAQYLGKVYQYTPVAQRKTNIGVAVGQIGEYAVVEGEPCVIVQKDENSGKSYAPLTHIKLGKETNMLLAYTNLRKALKNLLLSEQNETSDSQQTIDLRRELNKQYDQFVKSFGYLNKYKKLLEEEVDWYLMSNLEVFNSKAKTYEKSDVFRKKIAYSYPVPEKAEHIADAAEIALNYRGTLDVPYIAQLLGISEETALHQLLTTEVENMVGGKTVSRPLAFLNPKTGLLEEADEYLSGNVRHKLEEARLFAETDSKFHINVLHLEANQAEWLPIGKIKFGIGSVWIPTDLIELFLVEVVGLRRAKVTRDFAGLKMLATLRYVESMYSSNEKLGLVMSNRTSEYTYFDKNGEAKTIKHAQTPLDFFATDLVEALLNGKRMKIWRNKVNDSTGQLVYHWVNDKIKYVLEIDQAMTAELQRRMFELNTLFRTFATSSPDRIARLEKMYNDNYNESIERTWRVPKIETFPGANPAIKLRDHQKRGVMRALRSSMGGFYGVGTGKTFTIITTAMEMRRLGIAKKPLIVVQNATLEQFIAQARKLYPTAKILAPIITDVPIVDEDEKDTNKLNKARLAREGRVAMFAKIRLGDWDMIIIPQSQFDLIPDSPQRVEALIAEYVEGLQAQIDDLEGDSENYGLITRLKTQIKKLQEGDVSKKKQTVKDKARQALRAEKKITQQTTRRTDKVLYFEDLGIDALLIDEAHAYKRLGFDTNLTNVKGIDTAHSKRAMSAYLKITYIYDKLKDERNVSLWTGTPISNTMAEMWTMARFLRPATLKAKMIQTFDAFANTFSEVEVSFEMDAGGRYRSLERLTRFDNIPELLKIWKAFADVVIGEEVLGKSKDIADKDYINAHAHNYANQTPLLALQKDGKRGYTNIIINKSLAQKRQVLIFQQILSWYDNLSGAMKREYSYIPLVVFGRAKQATIDLRLLPDYMETQGNTRLHNVLDPDNKLFACAENVWRIYHRDEENPTAQLVFCDTFRRTVPDYSQLDSAGEPKEVEFFNVYKELKDLLIKKGIRASEIAIINDHENNRLALYNKVKNAEIRVLIGGTQKMGVGVDVQDRLVALHHIDAPTRPMDFEQRNGRIIRQGNMNPVVEIFTYGIEGTLDAVAYNRLKMKQQFINQIMKGDISDRSMSDALDEDGDADFFAQLSSMLTGSTTAIDLLKARKEHAITTGKVQFEQQQASTRVTDKAKAEEALKGLEDRLHTLVLFEKAILEQTENIEDFTMNRIEYGEEVWTAEDTKITITEKEGKDGKLVKVEKKERVKVGEALAAVLQYFAPSVVDYFRTAVKKASKEHDYKGAMEKVLADVKQENIRINGFLVLLNFKLKVSATGLDTLSYVFTEPFAGNKTYFDVLFSWNVIFENELLVPKQHFRLYYPDREGAISEWQGDIHVTFRRVSERKERTTQERDYEQKKIDDLAHLIANPTNLKDLLNRIPELTKEISDLENRLRTEQMRDMQEALQNEGLSGIHQPHFLRLGSLGIERLEGVEPLKDIIKKLRYIVFSNAWQETREEYATRMMRERDKIAYMAFHNETIIYNFALPPFPNSQELNPNPKYLAQNAYSLAWEAHPYLVLAALREGKPVPQKVLDEYKELPSLIKIEKGILQVLDSFGSAPDFLTIARFITLGVQRAYTRTVDFDSEVVIRHAFTKASYFDKIEKAVKAIRRYIDGKKGVFSLNSLIILARDKSQWSLGAISQNIGFTITKSQHTKTGEDIWLIKFDRVGNDDYKTLVQLMKPVAYYYRNAGAFVANSEVTEADIRALLAGNTASSPTPSPKTKTIEKKIDFTSNRLRRDVLRREIEAGKMVVGNYRYFNASNDMDEGRKFEDIVWENPKADSFFMKTILPSGDISTSSKTRSVDVHDYSYSYTVVYADELEEYKQKYREMAEANLRKQHLDALVRERIRPIEEYKQIAEAHTYSIAWSELYEVHSELLAYAYTDDSFFNTVVHRESEHTTIIKFMYPEGTELDDFKNALKEDLLRAERGEPSNQIPIEQVLEMVNARSEVIRNAKRFIPLPKLPTRAEKLKQLIAQLKLIKFSQNEQAQPLSGIDTDKVERLLKKIPKNHKVIY